MPRKRSSTTGGNCAHMPPIFSMPTPCSPVIVPPTSMHNCRMRSPNSTVRSLSPGLFASNRISGCRLPSPAWNTFAHGSPNSRDQSSICRNTRGSAARGSFRRCSNSRARCGRRRETPPCDRPVQQALRLVLRHADFGGAARRQHVDDLGHFSRHFDRRTVGLDQQHGRSVERIVGVHERLDGTRRLLIHHLEAARNDPGADDGAHGRARALEIVERRKGDLRVLRLRKQLHRDLRDHGKQTLAAVDQCQEVVAGRVERIAAEFDDVTLDRHRADLADVVHGQSVFQAMDAAGIFRDVAADRAGDLRRRIRCVEQSVRRRGLGYREVTDAGLDDRRARKRIDRDDAAQLGERQRRRRRRRAARRRTGWCPRRAPRQEHARMAKSKDRNDLRLVVGQQHGAPVAAGRASVRRIRRGACPPRPSATRPGRAPGRATT